jgi:hypothetical protein
MQRVGPPCILVKITLQIFFALAPCPELGERYAARVAGAFSLRAKEAAASCSCPPGAMPSVQSAGDSGADRTFGIGTAGAFETTGADAAIGRGGVA